MWANFHTHTHFCDGKGTCAEYAEAAIANDVHTVGFSSHAPLPFDCAWSMKKDDVNAYLKEIEEVRKSFPGIAFYKSMEIDFIPGKISPADFRATLDYTIGSIHFIDSFSDGKPWEIDGNHQVFLQGLTAIFHDDIQEAIKRYFELTRQMITESRPDVVGHLDKIKIQNHHPGLFSESDSWYHEEIVNTLDVIADSKVILEVNTRGIYQKKSATTYPSPWVLEMARMKDIPITISSDAHHPKDLVNQFFETAQLLHAIGFRKICILKEGSWQPVNLTPDGF